MLPLLICVRPKLFAPTAVIAFVMRAFRYTFVMLVLFTIITLL